MRNDERSIKAAQDAIRQYLQDCQCENHIETGANLMLLAESACRLVVSILGAQRGADMLDALKANVLEHAEGTKQRKVWLQ